VTSWSDLYETGADRLAGALITLLAEPSTWIQRRVEHVAIVSHTLMRRSVTIDLALPPAAERSDLRVDPDDPASPLVVPLGFLRKAQLIDFDLRENGGPLTLVRADLNAAVAGGMIAKEATSEAVPAASVEAARAHFRTIAAADRDAAARAFDELFEDGAFSGAFARSPSTRAVAEGLRDSYVLMVELPETGARHRLVGFATDQLLAPDRAIRAAARRLGLKLTPIVLEAPGADAAASFHAEIAVPRGGVIANAGVHAGDREIESRTQLLGRRAACTRASRRATRQSSGSRSASRAVISSSPRL
jgi:hypothetical protein